MNGQETRVLYVPPNVSWDAQWEHAIQLFNSGCSVWIHEHSADDRCRADGATCRCGWLTEGTRGPTLDLVSPDSLEN